MDAFTDSQIPVKRIKTKQTKADEEIKCLKNKEVLGLNEDKNRSQKRESEL